MVAKTTSKSARSSKVAAKAATARASTPVKAENISAPAKKPVKTLANAMATSWLQDATLEIPVSPAIPYAPGERELEFSIGLRQQEDNGLVRSELRGRALVHAQGAVLALAEASYVNISPEANLPADLPQQLYAPLKDHLERLLALGGHTPPLPASLDKVD